MDRGQSMANVLEIGPDDALTTILQRGWLIDNPTIARDPIATAPRCDNKLATVHTATRPSSSISGVVNLEVSSVVTLPSPL